MAMDDKPKEVIKFTSLDQLQPSRVDVYIDTGDPGREIVMSMVSLSYARWEALADEIPVPQAELLGMDAQKRPIYDTNSATYQSKLRERDIEVSFNRLLAAMPPEIVVPGRDKQEQRETLKQMDRNYTGQLINALTMIAVGGRSRIEQQSRTFQPVSGAPG